MPKNLLQQLREMTVVVADTGDIQAIETFKPRDNLLAAPGWFNPKPVAPVTLPLRSESSGS